MKNTAAWLIGLFFLVSIAAAADFQRGDHVEARSSGSWYAATIIDVRADEWKVTYEGYGSNWDEWLGADKLRRKSEPQSVAPIKATGTVAAGQWKTGDLVDALSYSTWYPAKIIEAEPARWKVHYDAYSNYYDEWLNLDHIRARTARATSGSEQTGKPTESFAFPVRPANTKAGIEGSYMRIETYFWGSSLSLTNQAWFFTKDGRFSKEPEGGFNFQDFAAGKTPRKTDGTYWIKGDTLTLAWADGSQPTEYSFEQNSNKLKIGGIGATPVKGFKKGWRFNGAYEGGASISGMASSNTIAFRADGTFAGSSTATFSSTGDRTSVSGGVQGEAAGTYEFDGYTLTMTHKDGSVQKFTVFAFGVGDAAGRPEYIYRDGTMMKRQQ